MCVCVSIISTGSMSPELPKEPRLSSHSVLTEILCVLSHVEFLVSYLYERVEKNESFHLTKEKEKELELLCVLDISLFQFRLIWLHYCLLI